MNLDKKTKKIIVIAVLVCIALFSLFFLGNKYSNPDAYAKIISILDEKKNNVMGLTASTSAASIAITAIPDDIGTPIANQLADLSSYLLLILTIIYLEKYLLTIIGFAVFKFIIPIVCLLFCVYILKPENLSFRKVASKILVFALALFLLIPTSVSISNMIDKTYQESINETLDKTNQEIEVEEQTVQQEDSNEEDLKWYEKIYNVFSDAIDDVKDTVKSSTSGAIAKAKNLLSNFIEATAVMIVTSCVIPILTVVVFIWLTKIILGIEIGKPNYLELENKIKSLTHKDNKKNEG